MTGELADVVGRVVGGGVVGNAFTNTHTNDNKISSHMLGQHTHSRCSL